METKEHLPLPLRKKSREIDAYLEARQEEEEKEIKAKVAGQETAPGEQETTEDNSQDTPKEAAQENTEKELEEWKKRYAALRNKRGEKYDAALAEIEASRQKIAELETILASLQTDGTPFEAPQEFVEEFGEDEARAYADSVNQAISSSVAPLHQKVEAIKNTVLGREKQTLQRQQEEVFKAKVDAFRANISEIIKADATEIEMSPGFINFAKKTIDPASGRTLEELYLHAFNGNDAKRAAEIIQSYKQPQPRTVPNDAASGDVGVKHEKPITRAFIKKFFFDVQQGRYKGREEKAAAIRKKILAASQSGLVT